MLLPGFLTTLLSAWLALGMSLNQSLPEFTVSLRDRVKNQALPLAFCENTKLISADQLDSSSPSKRMSFCAVHYSLSSCLSNRHMSVWGLILGYCFPLYKFTEVPSPCSWLCDLSFCQDHKLAWNIMLQLWVSMNFWHRINSTMKY